MHRSPIYFWFFNIITTAIVATLSYGFIKNLYFFNEDQMNLYLYYAGGVRPWPHNILSQSLHPTHLLFGSNPEGHFILVLFLYIILCVTLSFFVWKITGSKTVAFLSSILLAAGGTGSQMLFMVETGWNSLYLIFSLVTLLAYNAYLHNHRFAYYFIALALFSISLYLFPYRAFSFIALILATSLFIINKPLKNHLTAFIRDCAPFLVVHLIFYLLLPVFFYKVQGGTGLLANIVDEYRFSYLLNLLADFGNFVIPSIFTEKFSLYIGNKYLIIFYSLITFLSLGFFTWIFIQKALKNTRNLVLFTFFNLIFIILSFYIYQGDLELFIERYLGLLFITALINLILFLKLEPNTKRTLTYLTTCFLGSFILFHLKEPHLLHQSWSRYIMHAYPLYVALLSYKVFKLFLQNSKFKIRIVGYGIFVFLIILNLLANFLSPLKTEVLARSSYIKEFNSSLKNHVPSLSADGKYLFYFDTASDPSTQKLLGSFFATGAGSEEMVLANIYKLNTNNFKLITNYDQFITELSKNNHTNAFVFYYSQDKKLLNLTSDFFSDGKKSNITFSSQPQPDRLEYSSKILVTESGSKSANEIIEIPLGNFPAYKPVTLTIKMSAQPLISQIYKYPYADESYFNQTDKELYSTDPDNSQQRSELLQFIRERQKIKENITLRSSGSEDFQNIENITDLNPDTAWQANKKGWVDKHPTWVEVEFSNETLIGEIRWSSRREFTLPISYEYQSLSFDTNNWEKIYSVQNREVSTKKMIVDNFPQVKTKKLRMVIFDTKGGDTPTFTEMEFLSNPYQVQSEQANLLLKHPLTEINNKAELIEIFETVSNQLNIIIYSISDKHSDKTYNPPVIKTLYLDGQENEYTFVLPPGGTSLTELLIELPNIPLSAEISSMSLSNL